MVIRFFWFQITAMEWGGRIAYGIHLLLLLFIFSLMVYAWDYF